MKETGQEWIDRAKEGKLNRRDVWFLVQHQFWPKVGYGLCCNTSTLKQLSMCMKKQYWQLIPIGGVIRSAPAMTRQMSKVFFGVCVCVCLGLRLRGSFSIYESIKTIGQGVLDARMIYRLSEHRTLYTTSISTRGAGGLDSK
jgi:hypothetical protein